MPLHILWQGIFNILDQWHEVCYIIGPVSISQKYSAHSREIIVKHLQKFYRPEHAEMFVTPRNPIKFKKRQWIWKVFLQLQVLHYKN